MKHILCCLSLLGATVPVAAQGAIPCNQWSFIHDVGSVGMTRIITGDPLRRIGICGYVLVASGNSATFQIASGTGLNCSTQQNPLSPPINIGNGNNLVNRNPDVVEHAEPAQDLCASATGSGSTLDAILYWTYY